MIEAPSKLIFNQNFSCKRYNQIKNFLKGNSYKMIHLGEDRISLLQIAQILVK